MAVAWSAVAEASRLGKTGHINEALRLLISLEPQCESDCDRAALSLAKSSCFAHLGQITEAFAYIETAKKFAATHRELMLQIEMSEAAGRILSKEYQTACALYEHIAATYTDLLSEDPESAGEFNERYGYALFHVERYGQAIDIFRSLIQSKRLEDEQRVRLYL